MVTGGFKLIFSMLSVSISQLSVRSKGDKPEELEQMLLATFLIRRNRFASPVPNFPFVTKWKVFKFS